MTSAQTGLLFGRFAKALALTRGDALAAESYVEARPWDSHIRSSIVHCLKALTTPLTTDSYLGSRGAVYDDFAAYLRPQLITGKLAGLRRVPFNTRMVRGTGAATARWVGEGKPIPCTYSSYSSGDPLAPTSVATIALLSDELVKNSQPKADMVIASELRDAVAEQLNRSFIDPTYVGVTGEQPASISYGAQQYESAGATVTAIDADLARMVRYLVGNQMSLATAAWALHPQTAVSLSLMRGTSGAPAYPGVTATGGVLAGLPVVTSTALSTAGSPDERYIALVQADQIDLADDDTGSLDMSRHVALQMDDSPSSSATPMTSLWQQGLVGLKVRRYVNWQPRRSGAVVTLRSVTY